MITLKDTKIKSVDFSSASYKQDLQRFTIEITGFSNKETADQLIKMIQENRYHQSINLSADDYGFRVELSE